MNFTSAMTSQTVHVNSERQQHNTTSPYMLPNDATEHDRLDTQAKVVVEMLGGTPFLALLFLTDPRAAVDVGCGTGVTTIQLAKLFPQAHVQGLDLTLVPENVRKAAPQNITWAAGNVLSRATEPTIRSIFAPASQDFIFSRQLFLGIDNWDGYFDTAFEALRPGGVVEHQDLDWKFFRLGSHECASDGWKWHRLMCGALENAGLPLNAGTGAAGRMGKAGLQVQETREFQWVFVPSDDVAGSQAMARYVKSKLLPQIIVPMTRKMLSATVDAQELDILVKDCEQDLMSVEEPVYMKYMVTIPHRM